MGTLNGLEVRIVGPRHAPFYQPAKFKTMASGIFIGLTEDELLAIRAKAVSAITTGLNLVSYSDSGSSASKQWAMPPKEMLSEASFALYQLDPKQYASLRRTTVIDVRWDNRMI